MIVPLYKGKGERSQCGNYRGISLLSVVRKLCGRVLIETVKRQTNNSVSDEQCEFRDGRGCVDQIFFLKNLIEKSLERNRKLYVRYMDLEKAYDRVDREGLWMYGIGGRLLEAVKRFYRGSAAKVRVNGNCSESFEVSVGFSYGCLMYI